VKRQHYQQKNEIVKLTHMCVELNEHEYQKLLSAVSSDELLQFIIRMNEQGVSERSSETERLNAHCCVCAIVNKIMCDDGLR
jgi:hypothetical protein